MQSEQRTEAPSIWTLSDGRKVSLRCARRTLQDAVDRTARTFEEALGELARFYHATGELDLAAACASRLAACEVGTARAVAVQGLLQSLLRQARDRVASMERLLASLASERVGDDAADASRRVATARFRHAN